ncbi:MAG: response regulator [Deltaproteobacteria bacterium]|nr:response regulator [Deltaproteobacteria bacterium]
MASMLVIDDDQIIRKMMQAFFTAKGFNVTVAKDGREGIEKFKVGTYDVVVTDLMMPDVHGYQVIDFIKGSKKGKTTPVVLLTADRNEPELDQYDRSGFEDDYLAKPFDMPILEGKVKSVIREFRERGED